MSTDPPRLRVVATVAIAVAMVYTGFTVMVPNSVGLLQDDAIYLSTAQSLASGEGYRHAELPARPWQTKYPILFPALLSVFDTPELADDEYRRLANLPPEFRSQRLARLARLWCVAFAAALVTLCFVYWRSVLRAPPAFAQAALVLAALSPALVAFTRYVMSDLLYAALALGAVLCLDLRKQDRRLIALGGALAGLAFLTRGIGVTLIGAGALSLLLRRRRTDLAVFLAAALLFALPWWGWQQLARGLNEDAGQVTALETPDLDYTLWLPDGPEEALRTVKQNVPRTAFNIAYYQFALPTHPRLVPVALSRWSVQRVGLHVLCWGLLALLIWGFRATLHDGWQTLHFYVLAYGALILVWPFDTIRFLVPFSPFLVFFLLVGLRAACRRFGRAPKIPLVSLGAVLAIFFVLDDRRVVRSTAEDYYCREYHLDMTELDAVGAWIRENTDAAAVLAAHHNGALYLSTGRQGYPPWPADDPQTWFFGKGRRFASFYAVPDPSEQEALADDVHARFSELYGEAGVTHYVEFRWGFETAALREVRAEHPEWFEQVYVSPRETFRVFRVTLP